MTAGDVYRALWRYRVVIVALTAACVAVAWYATSLQTKTYEASSLLRVQRAAFDPSTELAALQAGERLALTYSSIVESGSLDGRIERLVGPSLRDEASAVDLSANRVEELEMFRVAARSDDPDTAAIVANAVPAALRDLIRDTDASRASVVVLNPATTPTSPVAPTTRLNVALAFLVGLIFNSALVLLFEVFRDRMPEPDELGEAVGQPVLATVPSVRLRRLTSDEQQVATQPQEILSAPRADGHSAFRDGESDR